MANVTAIPRNGINTIFQVNLSDDSVAELVLANRGACKYLKPNEP